MPEKSISKSLLQIFPDLLRTIDQASESRKPLDTTRLWMLLLITGICLLALNYLKNASSFYIFIGILADMSGSHPHQWQQLIRALEYRHLIQLGWWCMMHIVFCLLIPVLAIRYLFGQQLADFGWQWGSVHKHWVGYALLVAPILVFIVLVSFREDFTGEYPFYVSADRSWLDLLAWWVLYIIQFIGIEFLFRGFLLNGLHSRFGSLAIAIMCIPYMMIHFPKLWLEATGAIFFGFFLGILALRSRSIWGGVLVHVVIALSMDIASLIQTDRLPTTLLRH